MLSNKILKHPHDMLAYVIKFVSALADSKKYSRLEFCYFLSESFQLLEG